MPSAPAIAFEIKPAPPIATAIWLLAIVADAAVLASGIPATWAWLLAALLIAAAALAWRRYRHPPIHHARWSGDESWELELADGSTVSASVSHARVLGNSVSLRFHADGVHYSHWLLRGNASAETLRQLRMRISSLGNTEPTGKQH